MGAAKSYIDTLVSDGSYYFSTKIAHQSLGGTVTAVRAALRRLVSRGELVSPCRGHFAIVSPEHRRQGFPPVELFLPQLMDALGERYYVALQSAAKLHGVDTGSPLKVQVVLERARTAMVCGDLEIHFYCRKDMEKMPTAEVRSQSSEKLCVSSPEATAIELVGYADACGGLDRVAGVLDDLAVSLTPSRLLDVAQHSPIVWCQRLGYILDLLGHGEIVAPIAEHLRGRVATVAPLVRSEPITGCPRSSRWELAINVPITPEPAAGR